MRALDQVERRGEPRVHVTQSRCPFCHDRVDRADRAACARCLALHHLACWTEHGRCASCRERRVLTQPELPPNDAELLEDQRAD